MRNIHDAWVGSQDESMLQDWQKEYMVPFEQMADQTLELKKTKGDIAGTYRALQKRFSDTLVKLDPGLEAQAPETSLEGIDTAAVAKVLWLLAHDENFLSDAAPLIHDTYLLSRGNVEENAIVNNEGIAFQALPEKTQIRAKRNVQLDIIAMATTAYEIAN